MPTYASPQTLASYLTTGSWRDQGALPHSFQSGALVVGLSGLTADGQALARAAFQAWEIYARLDFTEAARGVQIRVDDARPGSSTTSTYLTNGVTQSVSVNVGTDWLVRNGREVGDYSFRTFIHEIGHGLGLGHAGDYGGEGGTYPRDALWTTDSWQMTVMSYFSQTENTDVDASYAVNVTPMMADILAVQALYGTPRGSATAGDTRYGVNADTGTYLDAVFAHRTGSLRENSMTVWDESGTDVIDFRDDARAQTVNLNAGTVSDVYGLRGNFAIAFGTRIENYVAGTGNDRVSGNSAANRLTLNNGDDWADAGSGDDQLFGGNGYDQLYGGLGDDSLSGGTGNDRLFGGDGDDDLLGGSGSVSLSGGAGDDDLGGGSGRSRLSGGSGNDTLDGGSGNDELAGGSGSDLLLFGRGRDVVTDFENNLDTLRVNDALWGGRALSVAQVLAAYATVVDGAVRLDFGDGNSLTIERLSSAALLLDDLVII